MKSLQEWRAYQQFEATTPTIAPINQDQFEPDESDWAFYKQKVQGRVRQTLDWLVGEIEKKELSPMKKGFIIQEIMNALNLDVGSMLKYVQRVRVAIQKKDRLEKMAQNAPKPVMSQPMANQPNSMPGQPNQF